MIQYFHFIPKENCIMAGYICEHCGYKYLVKEPDRFCSNCGYSFDYIKNHKHLTPAQLKTLPERIEIRQAVCSLPEKDTTKKGLHAYCTVTNHGVEVEVWEKFEYGPLVNKTWKFKQNPKLFFSYADILSIDKATFQGKPARFYYYATRHNAPLPLGFYADGAIKSPNLDLEMKELIEAYMA